MQTLNCTKQIIFYNSLKQYSLAGEDKYYYEGEYLFSLDGEGKLVKPLKMKRGAFVICSELYPSITYSKGYPESSFEIYQKATEFILAFHDGDGNVYRFGFENKQVVSPDRYAYHDTSDFNRFVFGVSKEKGNGLIQELLKEKISSKEEMIESVLKILALDKLFIQPLTFENKILSFAYIPKLLIKALSGEISLKSLLTPWKLKKVDFDKMEKYRSELSTKNFS